MNTHLNELRIKAGISRLDDNYRLVVINKEGQCIDPLIGLEKFAELIIEECVSMCPDITTSDNIKRHFGLKTFWS